MPKCIQCGYDLRGLPRPLRCPECGLVQDDAHVREQAIGWFTSRAGMFLWRAPPLFMAGMHDRRCVWAALRRGVFWMLAPPALVFLCLCGLNSLEVNRMWERWLVSPSNPGAKLDIDHCMSRNRAFDSARFSHGQDHSGDVGHRRIRTWFKLRFPVPSDDFREIVGNVLITVLFSLGATCIATAIVAVLPRSVIVAHIGPRAGDVASAWFGLPVAAGVPLVLTYCLCCATDEWGIMDVPYSVLESLLIAFVAVYLVVGTFLVMRLMRGYLSRGAGSRMVAGGLGAAVWISAHLWIAAVCCFWLIVLSWCAQ